jgi:hypothetical protein
MAELYAIISAITMLLAGPPYLIDILKGKTKPHRMTWLIWSVLGAIAFSSQLGLGAHWSLVYSALNAAGNLAVFLLSLKYGVGGWEKHDVVMLLTAIAGIAVSLVAKTPLYALVGVIVANFAGSILTIHKAYLTPSTETPITWFLLGTSSLFGVFAVGSLNIDLLLFPFYMTFSTYGIFVAQTLGMMAHHTRHTRKRFA